MKHLKIKEMAIVLSLTFLAACGGGKGGNVTPTPPQPVVSLSVTTLPVKARVGEPKTIPVTRNNTPDFNITSPANGAGCQKSGVSAIVCSPTAAGNYPVTLAATADASKTASLTVTVPEMELDGSDELELFADTEESNEIVFNAAGDWTATVTDAAGYTPDWIGLSKASGHITGHSISVMSVSIQANHDTSISGHAGTNYITVILDPNYTKVERTATITIATASGGELKITVIQSHKTEDGTVLDNEDHETITLSISPEAAYAALNGQRTFNVVAVNTDFFVSADAGAGCLTAGNTITCTPTVKNTYDITVTATKDITKTDTAKLIVTNIGIDITPRDKTADFGEAMVFEVTTEDTDFIATVLPDTGNGCDRADDTIICTPTAAGTYEITVTATEDPAKTVKATLTAREVEISVTSEEITVIGQHTDFTVTVSNAANPDFNFTVSPEIGAGCRKADNTIVCTPTASGEYEIMVTSVADTAKTKTATLTVSVVGIVITPTRTTELNNPATFEVTVTNAVNRDFNFTVSPNNTGAGCAKTANAVICTPTVPGEYEITIRSVADAAKTATATLTAVLEVGIGITPEDANINFGQPAVFTVEVVNSPANTKFDFTVSPETGANCDKAGNIITCTPTEEGEYEITVTADANPAKTATATLTAVREVEISITPKNATDISLFSIVYFTVTVTNTENTNFGFTVSPETGHGCARPGMGNEIVCTPVAADAYTLTVTAAADRTKTAEATFTAVNVKPEELKIAINETTAIDMRLVEAGTFTMGCTTYQPEGTTLGSAQRIIGFDHLGALGTGTYCSIGPPSSRPGHEVTLTRDFYIGKYEVSQAQWNEVMGIAPGDNPSAVKGDNLPQTNVTWLQAQEFIAKLNERDAGKGREWRLPTEAEWEYAAHGGHKKSNCDDGTENATYTCMFNGSNDVASTWYLYNLEFCTNMQGADVCAGTFVPHLQPVGLLTSNELGLYDMAGNAAEWVQDYRTVYGAGAEPQTDPHGAGSDAQNRRMIRGGHYNNSSTEVTLFVRAIAAQDTATDTRGFRLALTLTEP